MKIKKTLPILFISVLMIGCSSIKKVKDSPIEVTSCNFRVLIPEVTSENWSRWVQQWLETDEYSYEQTANIGDAAWCHSVNSLILKSQSDVKPCTNEWKNVVTKTLIETWEN